ncbi:MAG: GDP-mannose 4,6-dehydratase [Proteobacteria bacterium]|nr:GDP-mannose 4,6-dehydratase [Pseudomonadota bacterium]
MKIALITGAGGQDGRLLSRLLLADHWDIVGLVRREDSVVEPGVRKIVCDVGDGKALRETLDGVRPARVFHLAAAHHSSEGGAGDKSAEVAAMIRVNFEAAATLLDWIAAKSRTTRAVFAGSSQMYQAQGADLIVDETTTASPRTFYGHTKVWTRDLVRHARERLGLHASFAVLFNHESELRGPSYVTRKIVDAAVSGASLELMNIGGRADWSAARDIVAALAAMAERASPGEYVLGSGEAHRVRDWVELAYARMGRDPASVTAKNDAPNFIPIANPRKAMLDGVWRPQRAFHALVENMTDAISGTQSPATDRH